MNTQNTPSKRNIEDEPESNSSKKLKNELPEEDQFPQLFNEALEFIMKTMEVEDHELNNGIATVIQSFRYKEGSSFSDIDFDVSENLCAYFYRYSILSAELSRCKISEAINNCEELQSCLSRKKINVVSIGGGPGCDIVGMCSALYEKVKCEKLNLTVVDSVKRWKSFLNIVEFLLQEGDFGKASSMFKKTNASISFMCEDVCSADSPTIAYSEVVENSDVILMKSLLSIIPFGEKDAVAKNVVQKMKIGAVLLFVDSPFYDFHYLGLEQIYPKNSTIELNQEFNVHGRPAKYFGSIAHKSKAQIAVFIKKT